MSYEGNHHRLRLLDAQGILSLSFLCKMCFLRCTKTLLHIFNGRMIGPLLRLTCLTLSFLLGASFRGSKITGPSSSIKASFRDRHLPCCRLQVDGAFAFQLIGRRTAVVASSATARMNIFRLLCIRRMELGCCCRLSFDILIEINREWGRLGGHGYFCGPLLDFFDILLAVVVASSASAKLLIACRLHSLVRRLRKADARLVVAQ